MINEGKEMNRDQYIKTIETVINSPRNDLQKIDMLDYGFQLYINHVTKVIVEQLQNECDILDIKNKPYGISLEKAEEIINNSMIGEWKI